MSEFRFKEFSVRQDRAAMKVGTDSVLLGSWVGLEGVDAVLDVGTGTGLLSLMLAQRNDELRVRALDVCEDALEDAYFNFSLSPWSDRLFLTHSSLQDYTKESFDLIISNPPFFNGTFRSEESKRAIARHQGVLNAESLLHYASATHSRRLALVYPMDMLEELQKEAANVGWYINRICFVKPTPEIAPKRIMVELSSTPQELKDETLIVEQNGRHQYSDDYINLTKDFYLKM